MTKELSLEQKNQELAATTSNIFTVIEFHTLCLKCPPGSQFHFVGL